MVEIAIKLQQRTYANKIRYLLEQFDRGAINEEQLKLQIQISSPIEEFDVVKNFRKNPDSYVHFG